MSITSFNMEDNPNDPNMSIVTLKLNVPQKMHILFENGTLKMEMDNENENENEKIEVSNNTMECYNENENKIMEDEEKCYYENEEYDEEYYKRMEEERKRKLEEDEINHYKKYTEEENKEILQWIEKEKQLILLEEQNNNFINYNDELIKQWQNEILKLDFYTYNVEGNIKELNLIKEGIEKLILNTTIVDEFIKNEIIKILNYLNDIIKIYIEKNYIELYNQIQKYLKELKNCKYTLLLNNYLIKLQKLFYIGLKKQISKETEKTKNDIIMLIYLRDKFEEYSLQILNDKNIYIYSNTN